MKMFCKNLLNWRMFNTLKPSLNYKDATNYKITKSNCRCISTELTTALRPFYFAVHPDLFGQHPMQRSVNEDSLKQLSSHMESLYERKYHVLKEKKELSFYIRDSKVETRDKFKLIKITLDYRSRDPKFIIQNLLELCNLPTDYIRNVKATATARPASTWLHTKPQSQPIYKDGGDFYTGSSQFSGFTSNFQQAKEEYKITLDKWITANASLAETRTNELSGLKEEVAKLQKRIKERVGLKDIRYDCGWNYEHYRGCLKSFERLVNMHEESMKILQNRILVFAPFTGVSLEGHIMLFTGEVLNNWIDFINKIPSQDAFLEKVPIYESTLSQVLRKIKVGRRKFMPKQQAVEYAGHLMKMTTTLGDYLSKNKYPESWPIFLKEYEIVIESEAGPLMVNPTGQLIAPATCPAFMLIDFITANLTIAKARTKKYKEEKHIEAELLDRCMQKLYLKSLTKDDNVTPDKMMDTLSKLLNQNTAPYKNMNLHITNYYSVMNDGTVCIPWDFDSK